MQRSAVVLCQRGGNEAHGLQKTHSFLQHQFVLDQLLLLACLRRCLIRASCAIMRRCRIRRSRATKRQCTRLEDLAEQEQIARRIATMELAPRSGASASERMRQLRCRVLGIPGS